MKRAAGLVVLWVLWGMFPSRATVQDTLRPTRPQPDSSKDSALNVLTGVPFEGVFCFIKIVPLGRNFPHRMPIYNPERRRAIVRTDSLLHLLPDSLLKLLPRREKRRDNPSL